MLPYDVTRCSVISCSDYLFKLLLIGDSGVGKSCLLLRFAVSIFLFPTFEQTFIPAGSLALRSGFFFSLSASQSTTPQEKYPFALEESFV
jgi:hypothetical protein